MLKEQELMLDAINGNKEAFNQIVIYHRATAISFAYSIIGDIITAEDIVQDSFIKVYIHKEKYYFKYSFKTFLFTIIKNNCIDYLRSNKKRVQVDIDSITKIYDNHSPESILIKKEHFNNLFKNINNLNNDYKIALYLYAIESLNYEEISKIMNKSLSTIKILIYRARKKLKKLNEGSDIYEI